MSVAHQTRLPDEVIVADDGSTQETHELVEQMAAGFPCPLHHAWHEDEGFRLAAIRNKAVRGFCTGDYLILSMVTSSWNGISSPTMKKWHAADTSSSAAGPN